MAAVGPFFWFRNKIISDVIPLEKAEKYGNKLSGGMPHSALYDHAIKYGEYMLIPRGRVVWDTLLDEGILYIDKCLNAQSIVDEICKAFDLTNFRIEYDEHYVCPKCKPRSFTHLM